MKKRVFVGCAGTSMTTFDLDAYLARIGYEGSREPTLAVLRALQLGHQQAIPFENLDPLLGRPVPLDIEALTAKLVHGRRGGYCHEQNSLFRIALAALGFEATALGARVYLDRAPEAGVAARTHLALRVDLGGTAYLADVGFGGQSPTGPLRLDIAAAQATPHESYRIMPAASGPNHERFALEAEVAGHWKLLYRFSLDATPMIDTVVANHYVATHPDSGFRKMLMVARVAPNGRHTLLDNRLAFRGRDGETRKHQLVDAPALIAALRDIFGIAVPDEDKLTAIFATRKTG